MEKHYLTDQFMKQIPLPLSPQSTFSEFHDLDPAFQMLNTPDKSGNAADGA
jgi:hypothetical protein